MYRDAQQPLGCQLAGIEAVVGRRQRAMGALFATLRIALGLERAVKDSRAEHARSALLQDFELETVDRVERRPRSEVGRHLAAARDDRQASHGPIADERLKRTFGFGEKPIEGELGADADRRVRPPVMQRCATPVAGLHVLRRDNTSCACDQPT